MRTVLSADWVVDFREGSHRLRRDGVIVIDDDVITEVTDHYDGYADQTYVGRNEVLIPGLIDTHVHVGTRATHRLIADTGQDYYYGQPFLHWAITAPGVVSPGGDGTPPDGSMDDLAARFTIMELLRAGVTTFLEVGSRTALSRATAAVAGELGIRAYLGPGVTSAYYTGGAPNKLWDRSWDSKRERRLLEEASDFISEFDGAASGRVRALVVARELENCTPALLRELSAMSLELELPLVTHAAYSPIEWQAITQEHGLTPIEFLDSVGALHDRLIIEHGNLVAESNRSWSGGKDLKLIASRGASVAHSPINLLRRGRVFDSLQHYLDAGINLSLGADTYPRDLFMQMRAASYMAKAVTGDYRSGSAGTVFNLATIGGATALGREDLGRIAPGAAADVVSVSLRPQGSFRFGVVRDPVSALVDCAVSDDVQMVLVAGNMLIRNGEFVAAADDLIHDEAQRSAQTYWDTVQEWHPSGRNADDIAPLSYPE